MMADPWTPGPWAVSPWTPTRVDTASGGISLSWGGTNDGGKREREAEANARLIACSPELVEALEECASDLAEYVEAHYGRHPSMQGRKARDMAPVVAARALLARIRNGGTAE